MGGSYKDPQQKEERYAMKQTFLAQFRRNPELMPVPILKPGSSQHAIFPRAVSASVVTQAMLQNLCNAWEEVQKLHLSDQVAQEVQEAEEELKQSRICVMDLMDQKAKLRAETWLMEQNWKNEEFKRL